MGNDTTDDDAAVEDTTVDDSAVEDAAVDNVGVDDTAMDDAAVDATLVDDAPVDEAEVGDVAADDTAVDDAAVEDNAVDDVADDAAVEASTVFEDPNEDRTVVGPSLKACDGDEDCVLDATCAGNCVIVDIPDGCLITSSVFCHLLSAVLLFGTFVLISVSNRF